jgi:hypothetical protein
MHVKACREVFGDVRLSQIEGKTFLVPNSSKANQIYWAAIKETVERLREVFGDVHLSDIESKTYQDFIAED